MEVPRREPEPMTRHRLRLVVRDESLDAPLASLTKPESRSRLGERLFLYSAKMMEIDTNDRNPDGFSAVESLFSQYKHSVWNYSTMTWRLDEQVDVIQSDNEIVGLGMRIKLGAEAAHRLIAPPMYSREAIDAAQGQVTLPVFYRINDIDGAAKQKIKFVEKAIEGGAQVGGLSLVDINRPRQFVYSRDASWKRDLGRVASYDTLGA